MPLSSSNSTSELLLDDGIGSMDSKDNSNEFKINLKETLNGLQSLNGQSQLMNDNLSSKEENLKESDIVLQDGNKNDHLNQHNLGSSLENTPKVINLLENSKSNAFSMNDKARSSWDIVSKMQVNTPSLGNLLSKTKYIDCKDPNCKNLAEKNRIESEQAQQNGLSSNKNGGSGGNLFENIKDLKMDSANKMVEGIQKPEGKIINVWTDNACILTLYRSSIYPLTFGVKLAFFQNDQPYKHDCFLPSESQESNTLSQGSNVINPPSQLEP